MAVRSGPPQQLPPLRRRSPPMAGMRATQATKLLGRMPGFGRLAGARPPRMATSLRLWSQTRAATSSRGTSSCGSCVRPCSEFVIALTPRVGLSVTTSAPTLKGTA
eukprot:10066665-Alexandrium_andersonii.AAC.1